MKMSTNSQIRSKLVCAYICLQPVIENNIFKHIDDRNHKFD